MPPSSFLHVPLLLSPCPPPPPSMPPSYGSVIHSWHFVGINGPGQFLSSDLVMKSNVITKNWRSRRRIKRRKGKHEKLPCKSQLMHSLFTCLSISKNTGIVALKGILQNICTKTLVNFFLAWYMKQKQTSNFTITGCKTVTFWLTAYTLKTNFYSLFWLMVDNFKWKEKVDVNVYVCNALNEE